MGLGLLRHPLGLVLWLGHLLGLGLGLRLRRLLGLGLGLGLCIRHWGALRPAVHWVSQLHLRRIASLFPFVTGSILFLASGRKYMDAPAAGHPAPARGIPNAHT